MRSPPAVGAVTVDIPADGEQGVFPLHPPVLHRPSSGGGRSGRVGGWVTAPLRAHPARSKALLRSAEPAPAGGSPAFVDRVLSLGTVDTGRLSSLPLPEASAAFS